MTFESLNFNNKFLVEIFQSKIQKSIRGQFLLHEGRHCPTCSHVSFPPTDARHSQNMASAVHLDAELPFRVVGRATHRNAPLSCACQRFLNRVDHHSDSVSVLAVGDPWALLRIKKVLQCLHSVSGPNKSTKKLFFLLLEGLGRSKLNMGLKACRGSLCRTNVSVFV